MMLGLLIRASIDGALLVAAVAVLTRLVPHLSARVRTALWWCAAAKFVIALALPAVGLPILPADINRDQAVATQVQRSGTVKAASSAGVNATLPASNEIGGTTSWQASTLLLGLWSVGVLLTAAIGVRRWRLTRGVLTRGVPASHAVEAVATEIASCLSLERVPRIRLSTDVQTPFVAGLVRPIVVLPTDRFAALSTDEQHMVLCHELAHVKRADLWIGCVPAIAERLFFFHPLVHLATREYALWRESACDLTVLERLGAAPEKYARLLLTLGIARPRPRSFAAAGASWSFLSLKRRIVMLRHPAMASRLSRTAAAAAVCVTIAAMVPFELRARAVHQDADRLFGRSFDASGVDPHSTLADADTRGTLASSDDRGQRTHDELNYVMFNDDRHTIMSGSTKDIDRARRFKRPGERLLWFRHNGREYVVRDSALLEQVQSIWLPVNVIGDAQGQVGAKQGELGAKQGEIGDRQSKLGAKQGNLGSRQGELGGRQAALEARYDDRRQTEAERRALETRRRGIDDEMRDLDEQMRALDAEMRELDKPLRDLDEQMRVLDKEMEALDRKMEAAVERAEEQMRALFERAIATGAAEAVK
jgi:bla regulator protein BlaR1